MIMPQCVQKQRTTWSCLNVYRTREQHDHASMCTETENSLVMCTYDALWGNGTLNTCDVVYILDLIFNRFVLQFTLTYWPLVCNMPSVCVSILLTKCRYQMWLYIKDMTLDSKRVLYESTFTAVCTCTIVNYKKYWSVAHPKSYMCWSGHFKKGRVSPWIFNQYINSINRSYNVKEL